MKEEKIRRKYPIATASKKTVENRSVLNQETLQNALKKDNVKQHRTVLGVCEIIGIFCAMVWGLIVPNDDEVPRSIIVLIFFVMIPLAAFGIFNIVTIFARRKTKNTSYILLHTKIAHAICIPPTDPEGGSESYYFYFDCANYGTLDYEVSSYSYDSAVIGRDAYYLVVAKKRFSKKYKIVRIFSDEYYELSPELERKVVVI